MTKMARALALVCIVGCILFSESAWALNQRSFVSTTGSDANSCLPAAPCRNFAAAVAATASDGEIIVLSSGGYGPFSISSKSISIISPPGIYAGVTASTGNAINITLSSNNHVSLQGLTLNSLGANRGVTVGGAAPSNASVTLERVSANGFAEGFFGGVPATYDIADSQFRRNTDAGIDIEVSGAGAYRATIRHCMLQGNVFGMFLFGSVDAAVTDTVAAGNSSVGFDAAGSGGFVEMRLERCTAVFNGIGVNVDSGVAIVSRSTLANNSTGARSEDTGSTRLGDTWVTRNSTGILVTGGGTMSTLGNNVVESNVTTNGVFTGTFNFK